MSKELIERLEKEGPSKELNALIFCATAPSPFSYYGDCIVAQQGGFAARLELDEIPQYTHSIDAALTLVGYQREWHIGSATLLSQFWAEIVTPTNRYVGKGAKTPAIALCIAALKARALQPIEKERA